MKPAAKLSLQLLVLGALVFAATVIGSAMGWLKYVPDPLQLPDGGMVKIFRDDLPSEDAGAAAEVDAGVDSGVLAHDSESHERCGDGGC